ncbi:MAG: transcriptional regulator, partial [Firmicutes bacterium]|nr:transcriptional regulator [Bacillota bacterium]
DISDDFLVRQLYYPYRVWQSRVTKLVKPIFLVYSNGIYHLYEYKFQNQNEYSSIELVKQKNYSIEDTEITIEDIITVLESVKLESEPQYVPFPQADSFERVINLCELLYSGDYDRDGITQNYAFNGRQTYYYIAAGIYLGLIDGSYKQQFYRLTSAGETILQLKYRQRQLAYCERILSHKAFYDVTKLYFERGQIPERDEIIEIMKSCNLYNVTSESTYKRRASTIKAWVEWIAGLI